MGMLMTISVDFNSALALTLQGNRLYSINNNETHFRVSAYKARFLKRLAIHCSQIYELY